MAKTQTIEVDEATAAELEARAAEAGVSVSDLLAGMIGRRSAPAQASREDLADLDRQWAAIKAGEPTVPNDQVVRWLDTWGTPDFKPWKGA